MRKFIPLTILTATLLLVGCTPKNGYFVSTENLKDDSTNNYILVNDFVDFVDDYYNPSNTKFVIDPANHSSQYSIILESRLREKGYGVGYANMNEAAWLAWKISSVDDETVLVTYLIQDSKYSKIYRKTHGKYAPVGAFTIFNQKAEISQKLNSTLTPQKESQNIEKKLPPKNDVWSAFVRSNNYLHVQPKQTKKSKIEK